MNHRIADVGIADGDNYYVLNGINGAIIRNISVSDNSYSTSSSSFDFQNDGIPEFLYCSGQVLILVNFPGCQLPLVNFSSLLFFSSCSLYQCLQSCYVIAETWTIQIPATSDTGNENPVIADINLDGVADFITLGDYFQVFNSDATWAGADTFWNVHGYNSLNADQSRNPLVTNVTKTYRSTPVMR